LRQNSTCSGTSANEAIRNHPVCRRAAGHGPCALRDCTELHRAVGMAVLTAQLKQAWAEAQAAQIAQSEVEADAAELRQAEADRRARGLLGRLRAAWRGQ
jgi:hypothetical protein